MDLRRLPINKDGKFLINDEYVNSEFEKIARQIASMNIEDVSFILEGFCGNDLSNVDMSGLSEENFRRLTFDSNTKFPENINLMPNFIKELIEQGKFKSFSDYVENFIKQGKKFSNISEEKTDDGEKIDGTGTSIVLIDSCFDSSAKEFDGRVRKHIVIKKKDGKIVFSDYEKENGDDFHGKTTASLATGKECGVAPNAEMYLFGITEGMDWSEAKEAILKYIKQEIQKGNMKIPDIISMSADKETTLETKKTLDWLNDNGCTFLDSQVFWKHFLWGRTENDGEVGLDELMQTVSKMPYMEGSKAEDVINKIKDIISVVVPCTQRTSYFKERKR